MKLLIDTLLKILIQQGNTSSNECVRQVASWIATKSYATEFAKNPAYVTACTVEAVGVLLVLTASRFHDHNDAHDAPFAICDGPGLDKTALVQEASTVEAVTSLGIALDVPQPAGAEPVGGPFFNLILQQLLSHLLANLPELLEQLLNRQQPR